jgi:hypothetical protein
LSAFVVELRFQYFFCQEGISSSGILVTIIVDLGRENSNVALLAWSVLAYGRFRLSAPQRHPLAEQLLSAATSAQRKSTLAHIPSFYGNSK